MNHLEILRANLGAELGRRGLHQKDAAAALGLSKGTFSAKLHARHTGFKLDELVRLAAWLQVPFATLVSGFDDAEEFHASEAGAAA